MYEQPNGRRDADDAMARMSNSVMEDHQPVDTDEDRDSTARAGSSNAPGSEADPAESLQVEPRD